MPASIQQRIQDHVGRVCVVPGCKHPVRRIGKYCSIHDRHAHRHGGPLQQPVRVAQLKFYRTKVKAFLRANSGSPAIATVADKLHSIIADAASQPVYSRPKRGDWRTRVRLELSRLYEGGVTGLQMLETILAIRLLAVDTVGILEPHSTAERFQVARVVSNLVERSRADHRYQPANGSKLGATALNFIGERLLVATAVLSAAFVRTVKAAEDEPKNYRNAVAAGLEAQPLVAPAALAALK